MARTEFPIDFRTLVPDARPRRWLVLPEEFQAAAPPDQVSPVFAADPGALLAAFEAVALGAARTEAANSSTTQREFVQRSKVFRFPDYVTVEAVAVEGGSALCAYSRAVVGRYDFKVNEKRLGAWIEATAARLAQAEGSAK
ncbi:MAG: DUF1499 domain-containing protein [Oceanicaulis sp.]